MAKPKEEFRIGLEKIAVFENEVEQGTFLNAQIEGRRYKDDQTGDWKSTHSYSATQLAAHIALCQTTLHWMITEAPSN